MNKVIMSILACTMSYHSTTNTKHNDDTTTTTTTTTNVSKNDALLVLLYGMILYHSTLYNHIAFCILYVHS